MKTFRLLAFTFLLLPFLLTAQPPQGNHQSNTSRHRQKKDSVVRGVSFLAFKQSVAAFSDSTKKALLDSSWNLWRAERWAVLEQLFIADNLNGGWPPNSGAISLKIVSLDSGKLIDRYGGYYVVDSVKHDSTFHDRGKFVCLKGVPFAKRALPLSALKSPYRLYRIVKTIANIKEGGIIPWFSEPGLGTQFEMPVNIDDLKNGGYIVEVSSKPPN
jgi:hypothetical protein